MHWQFSGIGACLDAKYSTDTVFHIHNFSYTYVKCANRANTFYCKRVDRSSHQTFCLYFKETRSVTMNIFEKKSFLFKSFVKIESSHVFTINMFSTAENCMEKLII